MGYSSSNNKKNFAGSLLFFCAHPYFITMFLYCIRLGVLSPDGIGKIFDEGANGYVRAETVSAFLVQKAKDSRRIYAKVNVVQCRFFLNL